MALVKSILASSERDGRSKVAALEGEYDPSSGSVAVFGPYEVFDGGPAEGEPLTLAFQQGVLPLTLDDMKLAHNGREASNCVLLFTKGSVPFAPPLTPLSVVAGTPTTDLDAVISPLPWADSFRFGVGVNAITGRVSGIALKPFTPTGGVTKSASIYYRFIQNQSELTREIELSASGKYNIEGVTISASTSYLQHVKFSESFITLIASYESQFDGYDEAERYELTDAARELMSKEPARFREAFGDYFVGGGRRSSVFSAVYICEATSAESMEEFKASLEGSAPDVFKAEGSARFKQAAQNHNIKISVRVEMRGHDDTPPPPPPQTPDEVIKVLSWFQSHEKGSYLQAKLQHYNVIVPTYPLTVNIAPSVFVELRHLYSTVWDVRTRFTSCPQYYREQLQGEYDALTDAIMANKGILPTDQEMRIEYQQRTDILLTKLKDIYARLDFYLKVKKAIGTEPPKDQVIEEGTGVQTWMYGYKEYAKSPAVSIATSEMHYAESWHLGWREHTFDFGPDDQFMVVGWQVISNWNDGTNGQWKKNIDQILLTNRASVHVQSRFARGCDWTVRIFYVRKKDYFFDDTEIALQRVRPLQGGTRIAGPTKDGTLGLVVKNLNTGVMGFLTAGHAVGGQGTTVGQPDTNPNNAAGRVHINTFTAGSVTDIAFANVLPGVEFAEETIHRPDGSSFRIAVMSAYPDEGQQVKLCGMRAEQQVGRVVYPNVNIDVVEDGIPVQLKGVSIATYPSQPIDSGAPIVSVDREEIEWLGIHGGSILIKGERYAWFTPLATINSVIRIYEADQKQSSPAITLETSAEKRSLVADFETMLLRQSRWTWNIMKDGYEAGRNANLVPGETTITDMNLLMVQTGADPRTVTVRRYTSHEEGQNGADWSWIFVDQDGNQIKVYVQAKKLDVWANDPYYVELKMEQAQKLIDAANADRAHPLYVFYSYSPTAGNADVNGCMVAFAPFTLEKIILGNYNSYTDLLKFVTEEKVWPWTAIVGLEPTYTTVFKRVTAWLERGYAALNMNITVQSEPVESYVVDILAGRPVNYPIPGNPKAIMIVNEGFTAR